MKKLTIILVLIILLFGCEKERCYECVSSCSQAGYTTTTTMLYCGDFTKKEVEDMTMTAAGEGMYCKITCKEQ